MATSPTRVLTINAGSSSVRFAVFEEAVPARRLLQAHLDRIGLDDTKFSWAVPNGGSGAHNVNVAHAADAIGHALDWFARQDVFTSVQAVGHRIVHGLARTEPVRITEDVLAELHRATPYAPDHLPREIALIEALHERRPEWPQIACFDTAFHARMPRVATMLAIPLRYYEQGVRRYGFHGLSYAYLIDELARVAGRDVADGRVVLAHLGNGASMAAVSGGTSVDTSMGFTPAAGLVMSTRTGDLDPGVVSYLARTERMSATDFDRMVNHESGLLGVSELSSDMRDLLAREASDVRAADAVSLFCRQAKKWIGAFAAVLGGLDTLVFSAGIGENSAAVRARICEGLGFLGIELDEAQNRSNDPVISTDSSRVAVRVIRTDEEMMIARSVFQMLSDAHSRECDS